jgi:hypothetical protein
MGPVDAAIKMIGVFVGGLFAIFVVACVWGYGFIPDLILSYRASAQMTNELPPQHRHQSLHGKRRGILSLVFTNLPKSYGVPTLILIERYMRTTMFSRAQP